MLRVHWLHLYKGQSSGLFYQPSKHVPFYFIYAKEPPHIPKQENGLTGRKNS